MSSSTYSKKAGSMYVFNLVVGVGSLAMPNTYGKAGILAGSLLLSFVGFLGFITATYVLEALAAANCMMRLQKAKGQAKKIPPGVTKRLGSVDGYSSGEGDLMIPDIELGLIGSKAAAGKRRLSEEDLRETNKGNSIFVIEDQIEMGQMAELFFPQIGGKLFYLLLVLYLFGDLAIYAVVVSTTLTQRMNTVTENFDAEYIYYLTLFSCCMFPFCLMNFQKTKYLQMFTMTMRCAAMSLMVFLASMKIFKGDGVPLHEVTVWNSSGLKDRLLANVFVQLLGSIVFSFMCHHSLPGIIKPIETKTGLTQFLMIDYAIIFLFYLVLCATASFAFPRDDLRQLYTLNFLHFKPDIVGNFLSLYPVFTLTSNFPLICITLRNNLRYLFNVPETSGNSTTSERVDMLTSFVFSCISFVPPIAIAYCTRNIKFLVMLTGSYAGMGIMFIVPVFLAVSCKAVITKLHGRYENPYESPFSSTMWKAFVLFCCCLYFVSKLT
eukprot:Nk52_evm68s914 gene=Nk52_evmTU68s914